MNREPALDSVEGERPINSVTRLVSIQSRMSNILALGLMCTLGLGALAWYYAHALSRPQGARRDIAAAGSRAQGDLPLPELGRIDPPAVERLPESTLGSASPPGILQEIPLSAPLAIAPPTPAVSTAPPAVKTAAQLALERALSGAVFTAQTAPESLSAGTAGSSGDGGLALPSDRREVSGDRADLRRLATWLQPSVTPAVRAQVLPTQRLLLPKGAFIDCTLETAVDSTLPGMTTCVTATDSFGVDGHVVLMERGTKLIGETRGEVQRGAARIFVLWTQARTPTGVIVPLDSPGADELGRSGLPGEVHDHFWERFGAAILVSVIDGAVQAGAQAARGGNGNVVLNPSTSQDVLTEILKNTINIPPTVVKRNGDRIQVLVARDVDFRSVYELRSVTAQH